MGRSILVVDDDEDLRATVADALEDEGYAVECAGDGGEALACVRARSPALVLLDMMMPVLTGADVLWALRREGRLEKLPVIVISAQAPSPVDLEGVRGFVRKPFAFEELAHLVALHCSA